MDVSDYNLVMNEARLGGEEVKQAQPQWAETQTKAFDTEEKVYRVYWFII